MVIIDGITYNVGVKSLKRKAPFLDKYAERTEDGGLQRGLIGVYFNYELAFVPTDDMTEYEALHAKLTEPAEYHTATVPWTKGNYTFTAYFTEVDDELYKIKDASNRIWDGLKVSFIAKNPARTPANPAYPVGS